MSHAKVRTVSSCQFTQLTLLQYQWQVDELQSWKGRSVRAEVKEGAAAVAVRDRYDA